MQTKDEAYFPQKSSEATTEMIFVASMRLVLAFRFSVYFKLLSSLELFSLIFNSSAVGLVCNLLGLALSDLICDNMRFQFLFRKMKIMTLKHWISCAMLLVHNSVVLPIVVILLCWRT